MSCRPVDNNSSEMFPKDFAIDKLYYTAVSHSDMFLKADGSLKQEGDVIMNPKLGATFRRIAQDPHTFYNGSLARDIVQDITDRGEHSTCHSSFTLSFMKRVHGGMARLYCSR